MKPHGALSILVSVIAFPLPLRRLMTSVKDDPERAAALQRALDKAGERTTDEGRLGRCLGRDVAALGWLGRLEVDPR